MHSACHVALCLAAFAIPAAIDAAIGPRPTRPTSARQPPDDYYVGVDGMDLGHLVLLHGIEGTVPHMQAADVLFVGNSRLMFVLPQDRLRPFFTRRGLNYYALGFAFVEGNLVPETIIRKFDLRPKLVVAYADRFFTGQLSAYGRYAARQGLFDLAKVRFEQAASRRAEALLDRSLPYLLTRQFSRRFVLPRSRADGTWLIPWDLVPERHYPIVESRASADTVPASQLKAAAQFKEELEGRGARLVLCYVPTITSSRAQAEALSRHLGVPLIAPEVGDLTACSSGSHMDRRSVERFVTAFLNDLGAELDRRPLTAP